MVINEELIKIHEEIEAIIGKKFVSNLGVVHFKISNEIDNDIASNNEWYDINVFFEHISTCVEIFNHTEGTINNKHVLNEMRPILFNQKDSVYYTKILTMQDQMLGSRFYNGTRIEVLNDHNEDIINLYKEEVKTIKKIINNIIQRSNLDFIYKGYLQHNDKKYMYDYLESIRNGNKEHIGIKNFYIVFYLIQLLVTYTQPLRLFIVERNNNYL